MSSSTFTSRKTIPTLRLASEPVVDFTLEQVAREGARRYLQKAIEQEVADYIDANAHHRAPYFSENRNVPLSDLHLHSITGV